MPRSRTFTHHGIKPYGSDYIRDIVSDPVNISDVAVSNIINTGPLTQAAIDSRITKLIGTGSPNGSVSAPPGSIYTDTQKTLGAVMWRKDTGTDASGWVVTEGDTGWCPITTWDYMGTISGQPLSQGWDHAVDVPGGIWVRRMADSVSFRIQNLRRLTGPPYPDQNVLADDYSIPDWGFLPDVSFEGVYVGESSFRSRSFWITTGGNIYFGRHETGTSVGATCTYGVFTAPCTRDWPTSLTLTAA